MHNLLVILFLNDSEPICLHMSIAIVFTTLKGFNYCYLTPVILFNINKSFAHSGYKYYYFTLIIQFNINHSFAHS